MFSLRLSGFWLAALMTGWLYGEELRIEPVDADHRFSIYRQHHSQPLVQLRTPTDRRPSLQLPAEDEDRSNSVDLFWAFSDLNGRDYFANPAADHWKRVRVEIIQSQGAVISWQTVYNLLDGQGKTVLRETQTWTIQLEGEQQILNVEWRGEAKQSLTVGNSNRGGFFVRPNLADGVPRQIENAARQIDRLADGQQGLWASIKVHSPAAEEPSYLAIFDHPDNPGYPLRWQADPERGFGPVPHWDRDWQHEPDDIILMKHQLVVNHGAWSNVAVTEAWSQFSGIRGTWALWGIAQREGLEAEFLTPQRAIEEMTLADDFQVNAYAAEPMITQPMAFCWDDRGRMWIAENRDYESRGRGFSNSGDSRILILEDTDRDGVADKRTVFSEGIPFPAAIAVGFGGLWLGAPPNLLFLPDRDGDDRADKEAIEIRLTGWGIRDRHETLNSLHWGPDGWLYGCQGFATPSRVGKPADPDNRTLYRHQENFPNDIALTDEAVDINGGVWRYHPTKDRFEVVAHGFSNPWGIDYDAKGQLFITACVIPHMWHVIPGGIYHRQGGRHFNPYVYHDIRTIADHRHRSAHGGARVYLSDAFPESYQGKIFMANIHEHAVLVDSLIPQGSGFVASHHEDFLLANNAQWIGFSVEIGPEGGVYVLDWHDADICGKEVINKDTGRVFRIVPQQTQAQPWPNRYADLATLPDAELVALQTKPSVWHARRARTILQDRAHRQSLAPHTHVQLRRILSAEINQDYRLRALWGLHVTQGLDETALLSILEDSDEYLRSWAVQLLCEDQAPSPAALRRFAALAESDPSPVVRLYLAAALQRLPHDSRWPILNALVRHAEDDDDHNLPRMIWFATEPMVVQNTDSALALANASRLKLVQRCIARRLADAEAWETLVQGLGQAEPQAQAGLLRGFLQGLEGRNEARPPENWPPVFARLRNDADEEIRRLSLEIAQYFGDLEATKTMLSELADETAPLENRQKALRYLAGQRHPQLPERLPSLLEAPELRVEAIRAVAAFDNDRLNRALLNRYPQWNPTEKQETLQSLSSRPRSGRLLTDAIRDESIPRHEVPAYVARQLRRVVGNGFVEVWGPIEQLTAEKQTAYLKYRNLLTEQALREGNPAQGRVLFNQACGICHKMYDSGSNIAPDITGADRTNLDYLLSNIIDPSADIQDDYRLVMITTRDGRSYAGNIANESERQLALRTIGQNIVLNRSEIQSREIAPISMMPEGILEQLTDRQVLDLFSYLQTTSQVPLPEE